MINSLVFLDVLAIFCQLLAAIFAYGIYRFNRLSGGWFAIVIAFILQAGRRAFQAYNDWLGIGFSPLFDRALMLLISIFLVIGLVSMYKNFENFEVVEKKVKYKIKGAKLK